MKSFASGFDSFATANNSFASLYIPTAVINVCGLYIKFENIHNYPGLLLNIKGHQKILFEIKGKLKFLHFIHKPFQRFSSSPLKQLITESHNGSKKVFSITKSCTHWSFKEMNSFKKNVSSIPNLM